MAKLETHHLVRNTFLFVAWTGFVYALGALHGQHGEIPTSGSPINHGTPPDHAGSHGSSDQSGVRAGSAPIPGKETIPQNQAPAQPQSNTPASREAPQAAAAPKTEAPVPKVTMEQTVDDGKGLIATTRTGLENMSRDDLNALLKSTTDPYEKAVYEAALKTNNHKGLTDAIENLYKHTKDYVPGTDKESTILGHGDKVRIDAKGIHIIRNDAAKTDVTLISNDGKLLRPADLPMSPPVKPVVAVEPPAPTKPADDAETVLASASGQRPKGRLT